MPLRLLPRQAQFSVSWEKGLDQSEEEVELAPGSASVLHNWVPEGPGILRERRGWQGVTKTAAQPTPFWLEFDGATHDNTVWPPTAWKVKSAYFASNLGTDHSAWWLISIINDQDVNTPHSLRNQVWAIQTGTVVSAGAGFYGSQAGFVIPPTSSVSSFPGGNIQFLTATNAWYPVHGWFMTDEPNQDFDKYPVAFAKGIRNVLFTHPYLGATFFWDGNVPAQARKMDPGTVQVPPYNGDLAHSARAIAFHKRRFFLGGDDAISGIPWRLYYSDINAPNTWKKGGDEMFEDIGADDGTAIEDLVGWDQTLMIGKGFRVYALSGGGPSNFDIVPIDGMNAGQGRTLVPTPQGLVVCGDRDVWLYDGSNPVIISHPVLNDYEAGADDWRQAAYVDGNLYITQHSAPNKILVFDLLRQVWHTEDVSFDGGVVAITAVNKRQVTGPFSSNATPMAFRDFPDSDRLQDDFWNLGTSAIGTSHQVRSPTTFVSELGPMTIRNIHIRVRQRAGSSGRLKVTPIFDGVNDSHPVYIDATPTSPTDTVHRFDYGKTCRSVGFQFDSSVDAATTALWDINAIRVTYDPLPAR